jgi:bla regulator protein blaR1
MANHLWQSTLFLAAVALLTFALRKNRAQVRYWLWLVASLKFLVPFAALAALGSQFPLRSFATTADSPVTLIFDVVSQPFSQPALAVSSAASSSIAGAADALPAVLLAIWFAGLAALLLTWLLRWRRIVAVIRSATPVLWGREWELLRRLDGGSLTLVASETSFEPGVFGIRRPILLWPVSISARLSDEQIEAIFAHELAHVRRRDNLAAAMHMLVQALFWFHPLVWWVGTRLVDERERACDEEVIRQGSQPQVYAESILKTVEFYVESPLVCVSGVTGSDLKKRIEQIMRSDAGAALNAWRRLVLATLGLAAIAGPVMVGVLNAPKLDAQEPSVVASPLEFEVASIKPNKSGEMRVMMRNLPGGIYQAYNVTLGAMVRQAYRLQQYQLVGGPSWLDSDRFTIQAKSPAGSGSPELGPEPNWTARMRSLLADRFSLKVHNETRELEIYALVVSRRDGRLGSQLWPASVDCAAMTAARGRGGVPPPPPPPPPRPGERPLCGMSMGPGRLSGSGTNIAQLANSLSAFTGRMVVDRTGLAGGFEFDLEFTPDPALRRIGLGGGLPGPPEVTDSPADPQGVSIFTAVQEQLGLRLEAQRGPVNIVVVDRAEQPTADEFDVVLPPTPPPPPPPPPPPRR